MRRFRNFIKRLINVKDNERSSQEKSCNSHFDYARGKEDQSSPNVSHHRSRSRGAHHAASLPAYPLRSTAHSASSVQRGTESNKVSLRFSSPFTPPDETSAARRAPNLASVQPSRSPRPPFEESVRNTTRRTPGSEDATSVETEIGYPVVGPATSRVGHQTLTNTLYHQEVIVFSQDVSTNTPPTENYRAVSNQQLQAFSDRSPPAPQSMAVNEEVDIVQASIENRSNHDAIPASGFSENPVLSRVQSVTTSEEQQQGTSQENHLTSTVQPPVIGTDTSPFRPFPKANETPPKPNQVSNSEPGRLPTNFYFPSQMRRNRSNTAHGNCPGHRKIASNSDERGAIECRSNSWCCSKLSRANVTLSDCVHHDGAPAELCCSRIADEPPIEVMIHSLDCAGNCKIDARLEDSPRKTNEAHTARSLALRTLNYLDMKYQCNETMICPSLASNPEKLALNVMSCVSLSDLPSNLTVTDCVGKSVQNVRVLIVPYNIPLYPPAGKPSEQGNSQPPYLNERKHSEEYSSPEHHLIPSSKSDAASQQSELFTLAPLKSTVAVQASFPIASEPGNRRGTDCFTRSILGNVYNDQGCDNSASSAAPLLYYDVNGDNTSPADLWPVKDPLKKNYSECITVDSRESICDRWRSPPVRCPWRNVTDLNASTKLINQACGPDYPTEITSIGVDCCVPDFHDRNDVALSEKDECSYDNEKNAKVDLKNYPAKDYDQVLDTSDMCEAPPVRTLLEKPLLVLTLPENESKMYLADQENSEPIDMENHLFVGKASEVSVASSVYIGDDGKAVVTGSKEPKLIVLSVSESRQTVEDPCAPSTGAIPKRELGAKPKIRGETLTIRKKILAINDSPVRDRSSGMDDIPNLGARGHRVISERNRGRTRNQVSSRKNQLGIKEPHRSPGTWPRKTGSRRSFESSRRRCSEQPIDEIRSIWINPETEWSFPSSSSTIDITADLNQAFILSDQPKSPSPTQRTAKPRPVSVSKTPKRLDAKTGDSAELGLECMMCRDDLKQCNKEHDVCAECLGPICHSAILSEPYKPVDKFIPTFPFSVKNNQTDGTVEHDKREARCVHRPQPCPLAKCSKIHCAWKGIRSGIRSHMKKCHGYTGAVHPFRTFFAVEAFDSNLWENRTYDVEVLFVDTEIFELHKIYDSRKSCMWGLLRNILARDVSLRYTYNVRFQPQNIRGSVTFNCEVVGGAEEPDKAFEKGKRFKFYFDSFSQQPVQFFNILLKVFPKASTMLQDL